MAKKLTPAQVAVRRARWHRRRKVAKLHALGCSPTTIARHLGINWWTAARDLRALGLEPHYRGRGRPPIKPETKPRQARRGPLAHAVVSLLAGGPMTTPALALALCPERYVHTVWRVHRVMRGLVRGGEVVRGGRHPVRWSLATGL